MARVITAALLDAALRGYKTIYQSAFSAAPSMYVSVSTIVTSTTREEIYSWLGDMPKMREWIGDRRVKQLTAKGYSITNRKFEMTIAVERDDIEDDKLSLYNSRFQMMGQSAAQHPDEIVFELIQ